MSKIDDIPLPSTNFISIRRWQAGPEWRPRAHSHPFCEIVVVMRGTDNVRITRKPPIICEPGHVLFYPPDCVHEERQIGDSPLEFLCLDFEWEPLPAGIPNLLHDRQGRIQELTRWLMAEECARYTARSSYQCVGVQMVAAEIVRLSQCPPTEVVSVVDMYIHQHLNEPISLDDLAACCRVNKFQLTREFRARTGLTPMGYVRQVRLDFAYRLILESNLPLREIAPRVGIANEYHLSRLLKERYGRGARELRRAQTTGSVPLDDLRN